MKTSTNKKTVEIFHLSEEEKRNPKSVLTAFGDDISLHEVRTLIIKMRDICTTTSNLTYGDAKAREDLFFVTLKILRFFEAAYLMINIPTMDIPVQLQQSHQLKIMEKQLFSKNPHYGSTVPFLQLYGKWMADAGFTPGKQVEIISEPNFIILALAEEWQKMAATIQQMRA